MIIPDVHCDVCDFRCQRCGRKFDREDTLPIVRQCPKGAKPPKKPAKPWRSMDCVHRGDRIRWQECPSCTGTVRIKVFACAIHGECTMAKQIEGLKCCETCPDLTAPLPP